MTLTTSQIALLIELTEVEIAAMKEIMDDENASDEEADDATEHSLQLLALASSLRDLYRDKCSPQSEDLSYEALIDDIHSRRL